GGAVVEVRSLHGIDVARTVPRTASAGQPLPVTLQVSNTGRGPRGLVLVSDEFCGSGAALARFVRPGERREFRALRDQCRRGVYRDGRTTVESGFPFGVVRARRRGTVASTLVVHPKTYDVAARPAVGGGGWRA